MCQPCVMVLCPLHVPRLRCGSNAGGCVCQGLFVPALCDSVFPGEQWVLVALCDGSV